MIKVMLGIPTGDIARNAIFYDYLGVLEKNIPGVEVIEAKVHGQSPARNRNMIIQQALIHNCTHILFIDDDVILPRNALIELLKHDLDMVTGLYLMRAFPHQPIIFNESDERGWVKWEELSPMKNGLIEVVSAGLGCCLIRTSVFVKMKELDEKPWIRLGEIEGESDHWGDDIGFFKRARLAGFKLFADLEVRCGHICNMILRPIFKDGIWYTEYDTSGTGNAMVPAYYQVKTDEFKLELAEKN